MKSITFDNLLFIPHPVWDNGTMAAIKVNNVEVTIITGKPAYQSEGTYEVMVGDEEPLTRQTPEDINKLFIKLQGGYSIPMAIGVKEHIQVKDTVYVKFIAPESDDSWFVFMDNCWLEVDINPMELKDEQ